MLYVGWPSRQQELEISWPTEMMMMTMMMMTVKVLGVLERSHSIPAAITPLSVHYCGDLVNDPKISSSASSLSSLLQDNKEDNHHYYNTFASISLQKILHLLLLFMVATSSTSSYFLPTHPYFCNLTEIAAYCKICASIAPQLASGRVGWSYFSGNVS